MRKGKWINLIREGILKMNQPQFAEWLTQRTGISVDGNLVGKIESWGAKDIKKKNRKKIVPDKKIINLLESVFGVEVGSEIPAIKTEEKQEYESAENDEIKTETATIASIKDAQKSYLVPIVYGYPACLGLIRSLYVSIRRGLQANSRFVVHVVSRSNGTPISGVRVRFYSNRGKELKSLMGYTDDDGNLGLECSNPNEESKHFGKIEIDPLLSGYWSYYQYNVTLTADRPFPISLRSVTAPDPSNILQYFHPSPRHIITNHWPKVGVIDTGIDSNHPDLHVLGGYNYKGSTFQNTTTDNGLGHGTHVAGIIGSSNQATLGMAPKVPLISYRIYENYSITDPQNNGMRTQYNLIVNAINLAINDKCDIINISQELELDDEDRTHTTRKVESLKDVCQKAFDNGIVIVAATGNGGNSKVSYPAALETVISVSAIGRKNSTPHDSKDNLRLGLPQEENDPLNKFGNFCNYCDEGVNVQFIASGIGIISTNVRSEFCAMTGTSMACAVVSGITASLLSQNQRVYHMSRNSQRTRAIINLLTNANLRDFGFLRNYQGEGMPLI